MNRTLKTHSQEKLLEFADKRWYVKHTNAEVIIRYVNAVYPIDRSDFRYIVDIEFVQEEPDTKALSICGAIKSVDYSEITAYMGHPVQPTYLWKARVDLEYLSNVPYGTKAAEILFGKK